MNEHTAKALSRALDFQSIAPVAFFGLVQFTVQRMSSRTLYNLLLLPLPPLPDWCRASVFILRVSVGQEEKGLGRGGCRDSLEAGEKRMS